MFGKGSSLTAFLPLVLIIVAMYFLMIRPQRKKQKATQDMRGNLRVGDKITTIGGIKGKIVKIYTDDTIAIIVGQGAEKSRLEVARWAISAVDNTDGAKVTEEPNNPDEKDDAEESKPKRKPRKLTKNE